MAYEFVLQPQSVLVDQSASSVTFRASAFDDLFPSRTVTYQWRRQDTGGTPGYVNIGTNSPQLTLSPIANYDNDLFIVLATSNSVTLTSAPATFGIRLSGDIYSPWETATETGTNRVRRLQVLGYL